MPDMVQTESARPVITDPVELAAAYGLAWPTDACRCCGAVVRDGRCTSRDAAFSLRPDDCTCPTGEESR